MLLLAALPPPQCSQALPSTLQLGFRATLPAHLVAIKTLMCKHRDNCSFVSSHLTTIKW